MAVLIFQPDLDGKEPDDGEPLPDRQPQVPEQPAPQPPDPADAASEEAAKKALSENEGQRPRTPNPPVDEDTRKKFAQYGIFQDQLTGDFYKNSEVMKNGDGRPMTADEVRATLPDTAPQGSTSQGTAPTGP